MVGDVPFAVNLPDPGVMGFAPATLVNAGPVRLVMARECIYCSSYFCNVFRDKELQQSIVGIVIVLK